MPDGSVRYVKSGKDPQARKALKPRGRSGSTEFPPVGMHYGKVEMSDPMGKKRRPSGRAVAPSH